MMNEPTTEKFIQNIINKYSTGFRTYKNTLMFLITDPSEYEAKIFIFKHDNKKIIIATWGAKAPMTGEGKGKIVDRGKKNTEKFSFTYPKKYLQTQASPSK